MGRHAGDSESVCRQHGHDRSPGMPSEVHPAARGGGRARGMPVPQAATLIAGDRRVLGDRPSLRTSAEAPQSRLRLRHN